MVTVTYSPGKHLSPFLDSLAAATTRGTVTILADNGSTDGVPQAAAEQYPSVEFLDTGGNVGYGAGMNAGWRALRGRREDGAVDKEFVVLVNPDVVFEPGSIDALIDCARRHPTAGAIGPRIIESDGSTYPSARALPTLRNGIGHALLSNLWPTNPWSQSYLAMDRMDKEREAGWLSGSCLLVRWEAFDAVGGFDERYFMYMEDVDLGDRLTRAGYTNVYCPDARISHAQGHSTNEHPEKMLSAHHESAYRFLADRWNKPWQVPLRWLLRVGLWLRGGFVVATARAQRARIKKED